MGYTYYWSVGIFALEFGYTQLVLPLLFFQPFRCILGFSVFHSASHGGLSKNSYINRLVTHLYGTHFFHFPLWLQHHVEAHHSYTGVHRKRSDIGNAVLLQKHSKTRKRKLHSWQKLTNLPLMLIFPGQWLDKHFSIFQALFKGKLFGMKVKE